MLKAFFDLGKPGSLRPWPTTAPNPFVPFQPACVADAAGQTLVPTGETDYAPYTKANFQFERVMTGWRNTPILDLRLKK
jgi:hypothetical protein